MGVTTLNFTLERIAMPMFQMQLVFNYHCFQWGFLARQDTDVYSGLTKKTCIDITVGGIG